MSAWEDDFEIPPYEWENHQDASGPKAAERAFKLARFADLVATEPDYLVDGLLERDTMALVFGDPAAGKSFLTIDLAASIATGSDFHGRRAKPGTVIYIAGEGHGGLARRRMAWEMAREVSLKTAPMFASNVAGDFLDEATTRNVVGAIEATARAEGPPILIVIDTLARNFGGGDENSTQDMNRFIAAIDGVKANWPGCTALIVHHTGHGNKTRSRGSFALTGAVDAEYRVDKDGMALTVSCTKMKDGPQPPDLGFELVEIELGPQMTSLALRETGPIKRTPRIAGQALIALQAFGDALAIHGEKPSGEMFPQSRQCVSLEHWREYCDRHSLSSGENATSRRTAFHKAKNALQEKGVIRVVDGYAWRVEE